MIKSIIPTIIKEIQIKDFIIKEDIEGKLWIENKDGEEGTFDKEQFSELIKQFWEENF